MQRNEPSTSDSKSATSLSVYHSRAEPGHLEAGLKHTASKEPLNSGSDGDLQPESDGDCKHCHHDSKSNKAFDGWLACAKALRERDAASLQAWVEEADSSLTFAALFSGVVTAFIVESYVLLLPDAARSTVDILRTISQQLNGTSATTATVAPESLPFTPKIEDVMRNVLLFASLICALISSAMSIFIKSWLRESALDPVNRHSPRDFAYTRQYRHEALINWKMQDIVTTVSMLLQLAVVLFMVGIVLFVWRLGFILRGIVAGLIMFWLALTVVSALCATYFPNCPFNSPFSRAIFKTNQLLVAAIAPLSHRRHSKERHHSVGYTSQEKEWSDICKHAPSLASHALRYAFNMSWADQQVDTLFPCLEDMDPDAALKLVLDLVRLRLGNMLQDAGETAMQKLKPDSMEYQNLRSLSALSVKLVEARRETLAAAHKTHSPLGHHDEHLLTIVKGYIGQ
ncbi:hypothetical protein C2E23DRAFT_858630 [Lenzites betulinus]|nr:hypothetical protein C2E23DRAFT_858630 [Lenzites betulinus]